MGKYFDFTPVKPWAGGLDAIGNAMGDVGEFLAKNNLEREKAAAYRAQVDAQVAGVKRADRRDQVTFDQTQQDRMRDTTQKIASAVSAGRYGEAGGLAASSRFEDPRHPGQMAGVGFEQLPVGPAPVAPQAPVEPQAPDLPDYVQVMTPEQARTKAIHDALVKQGRPVDQPPAPDDLATEAAASEAEGLAKKVQDQRSQYATDQTAFKDAQTAYEPQVAAYQAEQQKYQDRQARPNVALTYPTGQKVTIDPREADQFKDYEAEHKASQLLNAADKEADPVVAATMRRQASMIQAQLAAADKGSIGNAATASAAAKARADLQGPKLRSDELIQSRHDKARVDAARLKGHGGGMLPGAEEGRVTSEFQHNTADITQKGGLRDQVRHQETSLQALRDHPENNTNWTNAIDAMIRSNTGKAAIIAQYKMYTGKAASAEDAGAQFLEWADSGALSVNQKRSLFGAMRDSYNGTVDEWNQANDIAGEYETADTRVQSSPALKESIKRSMHAAFPGGKRKKATDATVPGLPNEPLTTNPAGPPKVDETKLSKQDQGLVKSAREEIAKKGSMAASAKAYLQHLGLQ